MWSNDPEQNLNITPPADLQSSPKMRPTPDGGFYISWLDESLGYSLFLQRLDADGNFLWPIGAPSSAGILVYQRSLTSCVDYQLAVDTAGNAVIGIDSGYLIAGISGPGGAAVACKVSPDGELLFGPTGLTLSPVGEFISTVFCAATSDGGAAFSWSYNGATAIRTVKLDADGNLLWGEGEVYKAAVIAVHLASIEPAEDGSIIYAFVYDIPQEPPSNSPGTRTTRDILARKLDSTGAAVWLQDPIFVYQHGSDVYGLSANTTHVASVPDNAGGVIYTYSTQNVGTDPAQWKCLVQHIGKQGVPAFATNGLVVSTDETNDQQNPVLGFDPQSKDIYVQWMSVGAPPTSSLSIAAQRIDASGSRAWGETGVQLASPVDESSYGSATAMLPLAGSVLAAWIPPDATYASQPVRTRLLDSAGAEVWSAGTVDIKTSQTSTAQAAGVVGSTGEAAFVWTDNGNASICAQNINQDGSLGVE